MQNRSIRLRSMTGYGTASRECAGWEVVVEVRSVNHRYLEVQVSGPDALPLGRLNFEVSKRVRGLAERGRFNVVIQLRRGKEGAGEVVDRPLARALVEDLRRLAGELGLGGEVNVSTLALVPGLVRSEGVGLLGDEEVIAGLLKTLDLAMIELIAMRDREAELLGGEILGHLASMESLLNQVSAHVGEWTSLLLERIKARFSRLAVDLQLNETRLIQEAAILAERADVTEELGRLGSHMEQFGRALGEEGPKGRRLDFLLQEMFREVNTLGSKAGSAQVSALVVELKCNIEKLREQVANLE